MSDEQAEIFIEKVLDHQDPYAKKPEIRNEQKQSAYRDE
jgi:hypothetical protein